MCHHTMKINGDRRMSFKFIDIKNNRITPFENKRSREIALTIHVIPCNKNADKHSENS